MTYTWPDADGNASDTLSTNGSGVLTWQPTIAATPTVNVTSTTVEFTRTQANTFNVLDAIYHDGTSWELAQANSGNTLAEYVVVTAFAASFTASKYGVYPITNALSVGDHYFLSSTVAGGSDTNEGALYSSPLFYVEDANTIHMEVERPAVSIGFASGSTRFRFIVGTAQEVTDGAADFSSIQTAINFSEKGNLIEVLGDGEYVENLTIDREICIVGNGRSSIVSGTIDFTVGADGACLERIKSQYDITVNHFVKGVIIAPTVWVSATAIASGNAVTNSIDPFTEVP